MTKRWMPFDEWARLDEERRDSGPVLYDEDEKYLRN